MDPLLRVEELTLALVDGDGPSDAEQAELERLLETDPAAQRLHLLVLRMEVTLRGLRREFDLAPGTMARLLPQLGERVEDGVMDAIGAQLAAATSHTDGAPGVGAIAASHTHQAAELGAAAGVAPASLRVAPPTPRRSAWRRYVAVAAAAGVVGVVAGLLVSTSFRGLGPGSPTGVSSVAQHAPPVGAPATSAGEVPGALTGTTTTAMPARPDMVPQAAKAAAGAPRVDADRLAAQRSLKGGADGLGRGATFADSPMRARKGSKKARKAKATEGRATGGPAVAMTPAHEFTPASKPPPPVSVRPVTRRPAKPKPAAKAPSKTPAASRPCDRDRLSKNDIMPVFKVGLKKAISACLQKARAKDELQAGFTLEVGFSISRRGKVVAPRLGPAAVRGTWFVKCMKQKMRLWRFPSFCDGEPVVVPPVKVPIK